MPRCHAIDGADAVMPLSALRHYFAIRDAEPPPSLPPPCYCPPLFSPRRRRCRHAADAHISIAADADGFRCAPSLSPPPAPLMPRRRHFSCRRLAHCVADAADADDARDTLSPRCAVFRRLRAGASACQIRLMPPHVVFASAACVFVCCYLPARRDMIDAAAAIDSVARADAMNDSLFSPDAVVLFRYVFSRISIFAALFTDFGVSDFRAAPMIFFVLSFLPLRHHFSRLLRRRSPRRRRDIAVILLIFADPPSTSDIRHFRRLITEDYSPSRRRCIIIVTPHRVFHFAFAEPCICLF